MVKQPEHYNLESVYDDKISPLMRQITGGEQ